MLHTAATHEADAERRKTARLRAARLEKEAQEADRQKALKVRAAELVAQRATTPATTPATAQQRESVASFLDNVDTSNGIDACHPWRGSTHWNHDDPLSTRYERGYFCYTGLSTHIVQRILCFVTFGQEVPADMDVSPLCEDHLCCNIRHMAITKHGGRGNDRWLRSVPAEEFFQCR